MKSSFSKSKPSLKEIALKLGAKFARCGPLSNLKCDSNLKANLYYRSCKRVINYRADSRCSEQPLELHCLHNFIVSKFLFQTLKCYKTLADYRLKMNRASELPLCSNIIDLSELQISISRRKIAIRSSSSKLEF